MNKKFLIAGLGNIGPEYETTRHNIGFMILDRIAELQSASFEHQRHAFTSTLNLKGRTLHLIKPTTYMNLSGKALNYWLSELKIPLENLLVVVDDIALPFGSLRMRAKGSAAGHNGLTDIENTLGSNQYPRLRFGIDNNFYKGKQADYVLSPFSKEEQKNLPEFIDKAADMIQSFCLSGIQITMTQFND